MKNIVVNSLIKFIKKYKKYSDEKIAIIKYGLEGIYLTISKTTVILLIAFFLGYFWESIIFTIIFGLLRTFSYGLHAKKSWMCWLSSITLFILIPIIAKLFIINRYIKILICTFGTILIFKNSPADTYKRPIINKNKRMRLKFLSTFIALLYSVLCLLLNNQFICNCFIYSILLQNILISNYTYKLFNLPYNNYIKYLEKHPELNNL